MKSHFGFSLHEILWEMSWANLCMYSASIPTQTKKDDVKDVKPDELMGLLGL